MPTDTTIGFSKKTKDRLDFIKIHPRETYDDAISRILDLYDQKFEKKKD